MKAYRPSISDRQEVGFFRQDASCQTTSSEIVDLKEMISVFQQLQTELTEVRNELGISKIVLQVDYKSKLEERVQLLSSRVNDRLSFLKDRHEDRVDMVRRRCRTQLADAVAKISGEHKRKLDGEVHRIQEETERRVVDLVERNARLKKEVLYRDDTMAKLQQQNAYLENLLRKNEVEVHTSEVIKLPPPPKDVQKEQDDAIAKRDEQIKSLEKKMDRKDKQLKELRKMMQDLQDTVAEKSELLTQRDATIQAQKEKTRKLELSVLDATAAAEAASARARAEAQSARNARIAAEQAERTAEEERRKKNELERGVEERKKKDREEAELAARRASVSLPQKELGGGGNDGGGNDSDGDGSSAAGSAVNAGAGVVVGASGGGGGGGGDHTRLERLYVKKLTDLQDMHKLEVQQLKSDLKRLNRAWEKKLLITQRSLNAIKDESYMRNVMQRQAAVLQYAQLVYPQKGFSSSPYFAGAIVGGRRPPHTLPKLAGAPGGGHYRKVSRDAHAAPNHSHPADLHMGDVMGGGGGWGMQDVGGHEGGSYMHGGVGAGGYAPGMQHPVFYADDGGLPDLHLHQQQEPQQPFATNMQGGPSTGLITYGDESSMQQHLMARHFEEQMAAAAAAAAAADGRTGEVVGGGGGGGGGGGALAGEVPVDASSSPTPIDVVGNENLTGASAAPVGASEAVN